MTYARDQYAGALEFVGDTTLDNVLQADDQERVRAYQFYEDAYHNRPETFQITMRGEDEEQKAIYLPSAKIIVEATNRFLAVDYSFMVEPGGETTGPHKEARRMLGNLWKRERMTTKFNNQRRYGLIRGDALFHITADDTKEEGKRISIHELDPSQYFPIIDPSNNQRIIGCHIVDKIQDPRTPEDKTKQVARRQTYRKELDAAGLPTGKITSELALFSLGKWDDRTGKKDDVEQVQILTPVFPLPDQITELPVYHWRNNVIPGATFGTSEVSGIERLMAAMNQSMTDEDATLVMQGLGMYTTDAAPPQNPDGSTGEWEIGPGVIVETGEGQSFNRVTGVSSVAPMQDHINLMYERGMSAAGVPEVAAGQVDVGAVESGIALRLQLLPILAKNAEKEAEMLAVMDHMLYDLMGMWFPAYEGRDFSEVDVASSVGEPIPPDRESKIQEIMLLFTSGLITIRMAQAELAKFGYNFADGDEKQALADAAAMAAAKSGDPFSNRYGAETEEDDEDPAPTPSSTGTTPDPHASAPAAGGFNIGGSGAVSPKVLAG